jgi:hypothetical protein
MSAGKAQYCIHLLKKCFTKLEALKRLWTDRTSPARRSPGSELSNLIVDGVSVPSRGQAAGLMRRLAKSHSGKVRRTNANAAYPLQLNVFLCKLAVENLRIIWKGAILEAKCDRDFASATMGCNDCPAS